VVGFLGLLALSRGAAPGMPLSYTRFVTDVGAGTVRAVTVGPAGQVTGSLAGGQLFTTTIPVALGGNGLAGDLAAHHVQVTATAVMPSSLLSVLIGLLPLLLIGGVLSIVVRNARRHAGGLGGLGGPAGVTKAKARVVDAERPTTRFADVAGALRRPGRFDREVIVPLPNRPSGAPSSPRTLAARPSNQAPTSTRSPPPPRGSPAVVSVNPA
jgi:cell division protease FtsH